MTEQHQVDAEEMGLVEFLVELEKLGIVPELSGHCLPPPTSPITFRHTRPPEEVGYDWTLPPHLGRAFARHHDELVRRLKRTDPHERMI